MYPDTLPRPTRKRWTGGYNPELHEEPYVSHQEILDRMKERFESQPVRFRTDPTTGKVIASKSMARPEMPREMAGRYSYRNMFQAPASPTPPWVNPLSQRFGRTQTGLSQSPGGTTITARQWKPPAQAEENLDFSWILPKGAMDAPAVTQRDVPASDIQRQTGFRAGRTVTSGGNVAKVHPARYWPSSAFKLPETGMGIPAYGGSIDYTTGTWRLPQPTGVESRYATPYGRFSAGSKAPPKVPTVQIAKRGWKYIT